VERINITFYTDPICCWSWALEKSFSKLRKEYAGDIATRYVIYAMITDWNCFHDPVNSVSTPAQMGPVWMHASAISGVPMNDKIWFLDPPSSSVPAALAVKSAYLQSNEAGKLYFDALREGVMTKGMNVAKVDVLLRIAEEVEKAHPEKFDAHIFEKQLKSPLPIAALRKDMDEASAKQIARFPTLILESEGKRPVMVTGYRPYEVLLEAMQAASAPMVF